MNTEILLSYLISIPTWVILTPIGICSILLLSVIIERLVYFTLSANILNGVAKHASFLIHANSHKQALELLKKSKNSHLDMLIQYIEHDGQSNRDSLVAESAHKSISRIERFSGLISTIATVSPMFGLLGTVTGMMKSFSALSAINTDAQNMLAYGIAEALVTTATGLVVGIPAVIFYNYMVSRSGELIKKIEIILNSLTDSE
jgi:biopolymer transport protein ExbB